MSTLNLKDIVTRGRAAYEATLPDYLRRRVEPTNAEAEAPEPNIALTDERQREICLNCPLPDCVGIRNKRCPIRIEQRAAWRLKK